MSTDDPKPRPAGKIALFLLVLVFIAVSMFNYWATLEQAKLTRASNKSSRDALVASQRAYVFVTETQVQTAEGDGPTQLIPKWENFGNTPANPVYTEVRCPILVEKNQEVPKKEMEETHEGQQLSAPDRPIAKLKGAILPPKQSMTSGTCIFSKQQLALLLNSKPHFFLSARAIYRDAFDGTPLHITDYCSETIPIKTPDGKILFQTQICGDNNCTDDQCPKEEREQVEKDYGGL